MKHIHSSGRYDRPAAALKAALRSYSRRADVITLTETQRRSREDLSVSGYKLVHYPGPGSGDPAILAKEDDWRVLKSWSHRLTKYEQRRGPGGPPPPHATTTLLKHRRSGRKVLVSVAHLPSHVEGDWFRSGSFGGRVWRVFVWRDAQRNWKRIINRLRSSTGAKAVYVADWNINFKRRVFRTLIKALFPGFNLTWRVPMNHPGTHHRRVIDATVTNMKIKQKARLIEDDNSSDHRPYFEELI